jgi:hypothetical protein
MTQAMVSIVITLVVVTVMERVFTAWPGRAAVRIARSLAIALGINAVILISAHLANRTPELLRTVTPSFTLGATLLLLYALNLARLERQDRAGRAPRR